MKKISVVTVTYNNSDQIGSYFSSLKKALKSISSEIWIIDNASTDPTVRMLKEFGKTPGVNLILNRVNKGFGRANNQALRKVNSEYVLILNPDTISPENTIKFLLSYMDENNQVGLVTCRVEMENHKLDLACRRGFPTPWRSFCRMVYLDRLFPSSKLFGGYNLTFLPEDQIIEIDSAVGAFMLIRKRVLDEVGIFDESFFMYGEDIDLCYRIKECGWKIIYNPKVKVIHHKGVSSGIKFHTARLSKATFEQRLKMLGYFHQSMHIFYNKHYGKVYPRWLNKLVMVSVNLKLWYSIIRLRILGF